MGAGLVIYPSGSLSRRLYTYYPDLKLSVTTSVGMRITPGKTEDPLIGYLTPSWYQFKLDISRKKCRFSFYNIDLPKYKLEDKEHRPENWSLKSVCCHLQTQTDLEEELR